MGLNLYIDNTTLSDMTSGGLREPLEVFRIGQEIEIEPVIKATIDKVEVLKDATPSIKPLDDEGTYRIVARILGGYAQTIPGVEREVSCDDGEEETYWGVVYLVVDFGVLSRAVINFPVRCRLCRAGRESFMYVPIEEELTGEMTFKRGEYIKITGRLSPVLLDFWEGAITVRPFRGVIKEFKLLPGNGGVLRVEVTGKGKPLQVKGGGQMVFDDFTYDSYYARFSPRIDKDRDSFRVRFSKCKRDD
ncbi:hypothetical protein X802_01870 [Thermococcus guaymasensis DSM 11113]|uniref:Uncharacterized protein n=1 Tax=Thermococcus guaymasensis DSM 11113 TaxID=1432656 RepID=A0A0X1KN16_9EURY|nr:hypothetical protein [Thermococcus guaymasensis]AJC72647.1 hypothetical protein X802_01870 [Thermococcus guaymasensis DSM 11113]